eukprot:gene22669-27186_t
MCFRILLAVIAIYFAVALIQSIWPWLLLIASIVSVGGIITVVVIRATRNRWDIAIARKQWSESAAHHALRN